MKLISCSIEAYWNIEAVVQSLLEIATMKKRMVKTEWCFSSIRDALTPKLAGQ